MRLCMKMRRNKLEEIKRATKRACLSSVSSFVRFSLRYALSHREEFSAWLLDKLSNCEPSPSGGDEMVVVCIRIDEEKFKHLICISDSLSTNPSTILKLFVEFTLDALAHPSS